MITTQKDFFTEVAKRANVTKKSVKDIYDAMIEVIVESANSADETRTIIPEIGNLVINTRDAYTGKNPKTGEAIEVPASRRARIRINPKFAANFVEATPKKKNVVKKAKKAIKKK